ncbi:MAG: DISARM system helicase DrmA, partial [Chloroflexota bacterium]
FLLLNIPALVDPAHTDRIDPTRAKADLLWFPTGGGKTEAYLGVAAFAMALRRLQGEVGGYSGMAGVAVLMRYTLRLLTLQQFQRATALICAMELIRREDESRWGTEPFRIGLWVGQRSTPNRTEDSAQAIREDKGMYSGMGSKGTPLQLTNCPWCGRPLSANNVRVETFERGRGRTFQYCSDPLGQCEFSLRRSPDEGLPIVVVDEEIYRRLPSLLIATVDKFAQMPWKGETQALFGRVSSCCPRHGYRTPDLEDSDSHPAIKGMESQFPAVKTQACSPLRPPDLIIQDELHLISGPLGTLVGLYETAVDRLCSWELNGVRVRPKVIASTATIRRAQNQVHNLFLRDVQIFPPSGLDSGDNFFSQRRPAGPDAPGRLYLGVCAPGTRMKTILIRVYVAYLAAAQKLFKDYGALADPWMTLIGYFNSMRELGGMRRVTDDAVRTRLRQMDARGLVKRYIEPDTTEELTSRKSAVDIPRILDRLEKTFPAQRGEARPYDVVLATNMISVGVDVNRLGLMVVASQPKATSEYIQATSRVGRAFPGVVCTVYNWARPRDLSHYERFEHYHATFYQQVEALSVTPFSPRALDRGLSGVYVAQLRLLEDELNPNDSAGRFTYPHPLLEDVEQDISRRAGLVTASQKTRDLAEKMLKARRDEWLSRVQSTGGGSVLNYENARHTGREIPLLKKPTEKGEGYFFCLNSLRDVEPQVRLILSDQEMDTLPLVQSAQQPELPAAKEEGLPNA